MQLTAPAATACLFDRQRLPNAGRKAARLLALGALVASVLIAGSVTCAADAWPQFRGPTADGIAAETRVPLQWDRETNIRWRTELPGQGWASPVIGEGSVYVSAAIRRNADSDDDYDLALILIDQESGEIRRVSNLIEQDSATSPAIHKKNSHASPTPLLAGEFVFVHFGHQGTACTDRQGNLVWVNRDHTRSIRSTVTAVRPCWWPGG